MLRDWLCVTRKLDLTGLERARMRQVSTGFRAGGRSHSLTDGLVYLALQELATRIAHWNTGRLLDGDGAVILKRVAADENLHFLFYRELAAAALQADPSRTVEAIDRQVTSFEMPGRGDRRVRRPRRCHRRGQDLRLSHPLRAGPGASGYDTLGSGISRGPRL